MASDGTQPSVGLVVAGYRIEELLGRGGMGVVFLAEHLHLRRRVALKVLTADLVADPEFRERFVRESQLAASLDHPNIVPIYDAGESEGVLYIAMRYVEGSDLKTVLEREGSLTPQRALAVIEQVAAGLDAAHDAGLVHRDVKPANILIGFGNRAYLTDFGIARKTTSHGLTKTGSFLGTIDYCPPEQIEGKTLDGRADIYSLGCVLYHCLAGQPPYVRESEVQVIHAHLLEPVPALTTIRPDLPHQLDGVLATAMAKYRDVRYATATALATALREAVSSAAPTVGPPPQTVTAPVTTTSPFTPADQRPRIRLAQTASNALARRSVLRPLIVLAIVFACAAAGIGAYFLLDRLGGDSRVTATRPTTMPEPTAPPSTQRQPTTKSLPKAPSYMSQIRPSLDRLSASAQRLGPVLRQTSEPADLDPVRRVALEERARIISLRTPLLGLRKPANRRAHLYLLNASGSHLRYLDLLARATSGSHREGLDTLPAVRSTINHTMDEYARFFAEEPRARYAQSPITRSGLRSLDGVKRAVDLLCRPQTALSARYCGAFGSCEGSAPCFQSNSSETQPVEQCFATNYVVRCASRYSQQRVLLEIINGVSSAHAERLGYYRFNGPPMPEGKQFTTWAGTIRCDSSRHGITCIAPRGGRGFRIGDHYFQLIEGGIFGPRIRA